MKGSRRWRRVAVAIVLGALGVALLAGFFTLSDAARKGWSSDFEGLLLHLERGYPNLEWIVEHRGLDAHALAESTRAAITGAGSQFECAVAVRKFVQAFDDPHLRIEEPWHSSLTLLWRGATWSEMPRTLSPGEACDRFGIKGSPEGFDLSFGAALFEEFPASDSQPFPAGLLRLQHGCIAGVVRIGSFGLGPYRDCGEEAWKRLVAEDPAEEVQDSRYFLAVCDEIVRRLDARVSELVERGATCMVVDLTGNGGGTDWVDPAARLFTRRPLIGPRAGLFRGERTVEQLSSELSCVEQELERADLSEKDRAILEEGASRLIALREDARVPVDRAAIFREPNGRAASSLLVQTESYTTGPLPHLPPDALSGVGVRTMLFRPLRFSYREGAWDGPLFLLADEATASASEQFVAMLRDAGAAVVIGKRTMGAGGGYIGEGDNYDMPYAGWRIRMPNCCRFRMDGTSEIEGIAPDVELDFASDGWLDALLQVLAERTLNPR